MLILISPAKIMRTNGLHQAQSIPYFQHESKQILGLLQTYDVKDLMKLMRVKEAVAIQNKQRFKELQFDVKGTCALETYDGMQYKSMHLEDANEEIWSYLQEHLCILSGLYGLLRPNDSIYPYRLEMQAKLQVNEEKDLYAFWQSRLIRYIKQQYQGQSIINLMSKEYAACVSPLHKKKNWLDIVFYVEKQGMLKVESTQAKKARGMMVRWMAEHVCTDVEEIKLFDMDGYEFDPLLSSPSKFIFIKR